MEIIKIDSQEHRIYDEIIKIVLIGDSGVGKTSILRRITDDDFNSNFISTIGVDFKIITYKIKKDNKEKILKIQFWDTAGQERFRNITNSYYRNAKIILVVFDMNNYESFGNINNWINSVKKHNDENIKIIMICNKYENNKKFAINIEDIIDFASKYKLQYIFTSAKDNIGFNKLLNLIVENYEENKNLDISVPLKTSINLKDIKIKKQDKNQSDICTC